MSAGGHSAKGATGRRIPGIHSAKSATGRWSAAIHLKRASFMTAVPITSSKQFLSAK